MNGSCAPHHRTAHAEAKSSHSAPETVPCCLSLTCQRSRTSEGNGCPPRGPSRALCLSSRSPSRGAAPSGLAGTASPTCAGRPAMRWHPGTGCGKPAPDETQAAGDAGAKPGTKPSAWGKVPAAGGEGAGQRTPATSWGVTRRRDVKQLATLRLHPETPSRSPPNFPRAFAACDTPLVSTRTRNRERLRMEKNEKQLLCPRAASVTAIPQMERGRGGGRGQARPGRKRWVCSSGKRSVHTGVQAQRRLWEAAGVSTGEFRRVTPRPRQRAPGARQGVQTRSLARLPPTPPRGPLAFGTRFLLTR